MLLRTFSATGGDVERTARTLGVSEREVRDELGSLIGPSAKDVDGEGGAHAAAAPANGAARTASKSAAAKQKGTEKGKAKGRR
jgi:hypothetical protein